MKWLSKFRLIESGNNIDIYFSDKTSQKVVLKKTKIPSGVVEVGVLKKLVGNAFPKLLDYEVIGNEMHLALQYIEGHTFRDLKGIDLCPYTTNLLLLNALVTTDHLHKLGYIHCDIKPDNMIFDDQYHVYFIDFGTAQSIHHKSTSLKWKGSIDFMAPEALYKPDQIDFRIDYYSLAKSFEKSFGYDISNLSFNTIRCLNKLGAIIPNERPSDLTDFIKILRNG